MTQSSRFWDKIADRYARRPVADEASYQKKLEVTRTFLKPDSRVLEFGCGTGSTAIAHAPHVGRIEAIDVSPRMIEIAREKAEAAGVANVDFATGSIEDQPAPERPYDAVLGMSILHLVADRQAVIGKVFSLLRPGGVFVSSTTCLGETMAWFRWIAPAGRAVGLMPLVRFFTPANLERSLTGAGFEIAHAWQPGKGKAVFIVARRPDDA